MIAGIDVRLGGGDEHVAAWAGQVSDRVARVPVDLFRYELMMTLKPVADEVIEEIVDTVFLPLVRLGAAKTP